MGYDIQIDEAELGLNREYLLNSIENEIVAGYLKLMVDIAVHLGGDKKKALEEMTQSVEFEIQLANVSILVYRSETQSVFYKLQHNSSN